MMLEIPLKIQPLSRLVFPNKTSLAMLFKASSRGLLENPSWRKFSFNSLSFGLKPFTTRHFVATTVSL